MAFEQKEGQGTLFVNEKQNDRQPDYKGTINIGGTLYEIAGWNRKSQRTGTEYISLQASLPRERSQQNSQYNEGGWHHGDTPAQQTAPQDAGSYQSSLFRAPQTPAPTETDMPADDCDDLPF